MTLIVTNTEYANNSLNNNIASGGLLDVAVYTWDIIEFSGGILDFLRIGNVYFWKFLIVL